MLNEYDQSVAIGEIKYVVSYRLEPFFSYLESLTEEEKEKILPDRCRIFKKKLIYNGKDCLLCLKSTTFFFSVYGRKCKKADF